MKKIKQGFLVLLTTLILAGFPIDIPIIPYEIAEAASIALNKKEITLYLDNSYTLKLNGVAKGIKWSSSNKGIATVSSAGKVTGVKKGTATIIATVGSKKYTCKVTVKALSISSKSLTLEKAGEKTLKINGATDKVTWKSSDKKIATVDSKGKVTGIAEGKAKITGQHKGKSYTCTVTVLKGKIQADITDIILSEEKTILITVEDLKKDEILDFEIQDTEIIDAELGDWKNATIPLKIIPLKKGTTTITITTDYKVEELVLNVTVEEKKKSEDPTVTPAPENAEKPANVEKPENTEQLETSEASKGTKLTPEEINKISKESSVQINTDVSIGSGFFIADNRVVTNYHVIEGAKSIRIELLSGETYEIDSVLGYDKNLDIAVLSVPITKKPFIKNTHGVTDGETVYTMGSSQGLTGTFTNGIVSNSSRVIDNVDYIQINAAITKGNSGGPLINAYGEVMGINTMQYIEGQNLNFAVNIKHLDQVSIDKPMTVTEFYTLNSSSGIGDSGSSSGESSEDVVIEDTTKSGSKNTAQTAPSGTVVVGRIDNYSVDYYKFTLTKASEVFFLLASKEYDFYLDRLLVGIFDEYGDAIAVAEYMRDGYGTYITLDTYLSKGTYYIAILVDTDYPIYSDMPYGFIVEY